MPSGHGGHRDGDGGDGGDGGDEREHLGASASVTRVDGTNLDAQRARRQRRIRQQPFQRPPSSAWCLRVGSWMLPLALCVRFWTSSSHIPWSQTRRLTRSSCSLFKSSSVLGQGNSLSCELTLRRSERLRNQATTIQSKPMGNILSPKQTLRSPLARRMSRNAASFASQSGSSTNTTGRRNEQQKAKAKRRPFSSGAKSERKFARDVEDTVPPPNWEAVYQLIKEMRSEANAPVDSMGCERLAETNIDPKTARFQSLAALMISSQTADPVTAQAIRTLQRQLPGGLTVDSVRSASLEDLEKMIYPAGFYRRKAQYIKQTAEILQSEYSGDIPRNVTDLCKLPGVGPKMAYLCMQTAWGESVGIGVDVHVHRICNRLGWVKTSNPEQTRKKLEQWLPQKLWAEINPLLVGFGQTQCRARNPLCEKCEVRQLCPSSKCS